MSINYGNDIQKVTAQMKADSYKMAALSLEARNNILKNVKEALLKNKEAIFEANKMDMDAAQENNITAAVKKRLKFDEHKLTDVTQGIEELIKLEDPIGKTQFKRQLDEGLILQRVNCPICEDFWAHCSIPMGICLFLCQYHTILITITL